MLIMTQIRLIIIVLFFGLGTLGTDKDHKVLYYAGIDAVSITAPTVTLLL